MTKTKYWLSILAISVVLVAGSLAVSPIAIADDDEEVDIKVELEIEQDGDDVEVEVKAKGLASGTDFTVRTYTSTDCRGGTLLAGIGSDTDGNGKIKISKTIDKDFDEVNSVSIRADDGNSVGPLVVCFHDTTPT